MLVFTLALQIRFYETPICQNGIQAYNHLSTSTDWAMFLLPCLCKKKNKSRRPIPPASTILAISDTCSFRYDAWNEDYYSSQYQDENILPGKCQLTSTVANGGNGTKTQLIVEEWRNCHKWHIAETCRYHIIRTVNYYWWVNLLQYQTEFTIKWIACTGDLNLSLKIAYVRRLRKPNWQL